MSVRKNRFSRLAVLGVFAAVCLSFAAPNAQATTLTIDSSLSSLNVGIDLYSIDDPQNPAYITSAVPQGPVSPLLPAGNGVAVPGSLLENGMFAFAGGTIDITDGGVNISIDASSINLLNSGLWQPGAAPANPLDGPVSAELGAFIDISVLFGTPAFTDTLTAAFDNMLFNILTGTVPLVAGSFSDAGGSFGLAAGDLAAWANVPTLGFTGPLAQLLPPTVAGATIGGTYLGGVMTIPVNVSIGIDLSASTGLPLLAQITFAGTLVATAVPEPSTFVLGAFGVVGMAFAAFRRNRK